MKAETSKFCDFSGRKEIFTVPFFQRSYVWKEEQWERCLRDAEKACSHNIPHFMGALIFKQQLPESDQEREKMKIIDGQQRFTTIILLVKALCDKKKYPLPANFMKTAEGERGFIHNFVDNEEFNNVVFSNTPPSEAIRKNSSIFDCYKYFYDNITTDNDVMTPENVSNLFTFVVIELENGDDEQEIFETINSIGVDLTAGELLKNELFRSEEIHYYMQTWGRVFEAVENKGYWEQKITNGKQPGSDMMTLFLRSYHAIVADLSSGLEHISSLFRNYQLHIKKHISSDKRHLFIEDMIHTAEIFKKTFSPEILSVPRKTLSALQRLVFHCFAFQQMTAIPYILHVIRHAPEEEKTPVFSLVETYLMRRRICELPSGRYNLQFRQLIKRDVLTYEELLECLSSSDEDTSRMPSGIEVFAAIVNGRRNMTKNKLGAVLLYFIEYALQQEQEETTSMRAYSEYAIEYLLPKKFDNWREEVLSGTDEQIVKEAVEKLGNLSLSYPKLPSAVSSEVWSKKLKGYGNNGLSACCKGLKSVESYLSVLKQWDISQIEKRTEELAALVLKIWPYDYDGEYSPEYLSCIARYENERRQDSRHPEKPRSRNTTGMPLDISVPHFLTEELTGHKPCAYILYDEEYPCFDWKTMLLDVSRLLLKNHPLAMKLCAENGENKNISNAIRFDTTDPGKWSKLSEECYIYTNLGVEEIRKTLLYMLGCVGIDTEDLKIILSR